MMYEWTGKKIEIPKFGTVEPGKPYEVGPGFEWVLTVSQGDGCWKPCAPAPSPKKEASRTKSEAKE